MRNDASIAVALRRDLGRFASRQAPPLDVDVGLARLTAALAIAPLVGAAAQVAPSATGATLTSTGGALKALAVKVLTWKVCALCVTLGAAGAITVAATSHAPTPARIAAVAPRASHASTAQIVEPWHSPVPSAPVTSPPVDTLTPELAAATAPPLAVPPEDVAQVSGAVRMPSAVARTAPTKVVHAPSQVPSAAPDAAPGTTASENLRSEGSALARLREVASRDPTAAITQADQDSTRFPDGVFGEEREAIAIGALVRAGRAAEAQARARVFLQRHPKSLFATVMRRDAIH
jgi:hypothetical protein